MCWEEIIINKHHTHYFNPLKSNIMNIHVIFTIAIIIKDEVILKFVKVN